ncbi:MAG: type II secretion system protein [Candidatus Paceibacterota bacterium]
MFTRNTQSFTLIELLIVIGILAILTAAVVVVLNPSELLQQSRDSSRMTDLAVLHKAISLLQLEQSVSSIGVNNVIYISIPDTTLVGNATSTCGSLGLLPPPFGWNYECHSPDSYRDIDGTGWIPLVVTQSSAGTLLSTLPVDPTNTTSSGSYYMYTTVNNAWELNARLSSSKYGFKEDFSGKPSSDGGNNDYLYEVGSNLTVFLDNENLVRDGDMEVVGRGSWSDYSTPLLVEKVFDGVGGGYALHIITDSTTLNEGVYYGFGSILNPVSKKIFVQLYYKTAPTKTFGWNCECSNTSCCWLFHSVGISSTDWKKKTYVDDTTGTTNVNAAYFSQPTSIPSEFYLDNVIVRPMY